LARFLRGIDLRSVGSGNIGATNTMRALGRGWGLLAFACDFGKGWLPVGGFAVWAAGPEELQVARLLCGTAAVLGHCFPLYLRFRGGKGVATGCGGIVAVDPLVFIAAGLVWLGALAVFRYVSLSSMLMGLAFPLGAWWRQPEDRPFLLGCALLAVLILARHRTNVTRLLAGDEPKVGRKGGTTNEAPRSTSHG